MTESFSWPEGTVFWWTGSATASAQVTLAENVRAYFQRGWDNFPTLGGTYQHIMTGTRVDVQIGTLYSVDASSLRAAFDQTALVHLHLKQAHALGSAGFFVWSGHITTLDLQGQDRNVMQFGFGYYANLWSAYG